MSGGLLAIECSGRVTSVAAADGEGREMFFRRFGSGRRETGPLFSTVRSALEALRGVAASHPVQPAPVDKEEDRRAARWLDAVVVGTGPGSYSGVRAGLALARGIELGLGVAVAGFSSLLGLPEGRWVAAGDARGGQWFVAVVDAGSLETGGFLLDPQLVGTQDAARLAGELAAEFRARLGWVGEALPGPDWESVVPCARRLLEVAKAWRGSGREWPSAEPIYLKPPHITPGGSKSAGPGCPESPAK